MLKKGNPVKLKIGDDVKKIKGYAWPGVIVARFTTLAGKTRYVVECTVPGVEGALHIYSPEQLRIRDEVVRMDIEDTIFLKSVGLR